MSDLDRIASEVSALFKSRLKDVEVIDVDVSEDFDQDGDPVAYVRVVYDAPESEIDPEIAVGLLRRLIPVLEEFGIDEFPVLSLVDKTEAHLGSPEAA